MKSKSTQLTEKQWAYISILSEVNQASFSSSVRKCVQYCMDRDAIMVEVPCNGADVVNIGPGDKAWNTMFGVVD